MSDSADNVQSWGPYELRPNPRAIFNLAIGTCAAVSTALVIPDAVAIIPTAPNPPSWFFRVVGLWSYAYLIWCSGFLIILHLARLATGGIVLSEKGLRLSRFSKTIPWSDIEAISVRHRAFFSKLFFLRYPAMQMNIFVRKKSGKGTKTKSTASFQFLPAEFQSLFASVARQGIGVNPSSMDVFLYKESGKHAAKKMFEEGKVKRILVTAFISISLVVYLGRQAAGNYSFNVGNKYSRAGNNAESRKYYEFATSMNPFFCSRLGSPGQIRISHR